MSNISQLLGNENVMVALFLIGIVLLVAVFKVIYNYKKIDTLETDNTVSNMVIMQECDLSQEDLSDKSKKFAIVNNQIKSEKWRFDMTGNIVIGRSTARCDIAFENDKSLASRHAVIFFEDDVAYISPISPTFELYVQDKKVEDREELATQQIISIGNQVLKVIYE